ncbi:MAG: ATP-binding cassette domain-containing protein [Lachnospirales bacterium]
MDKDIVLKKICKNFGEKHILNNYSMTYKANSFNVFTGKSGCGKTTLLKIIMGIEPIDSGEILGIEDKKISVVFQENRLCENLTAYRNVKLVCEYMTDDEIKKAFERVGLLEDMYTVVKNLSGGMKRRVAILRGILHECDILFLDEPFKELDYQTFEDVRNFVFEKSSNKTVICVSHNKNILELGNVTVHNIENT